MEEQDAKENIPPQQDNQEIVEKIRRIRLRYPELPCYIQQMMKDRDAVKAQYLATKQQEKKIEYVTVFEAVENELRLHQYRVYRKTHPDLILGPDERKLQTHLADYIRELIKKNITNRLCYITTREIFYKMNYNGMKSAMKILVEALDSRFGYEILIGLDNQTLKIIRK
ncbi:uncharacterized protein LOC108904820 [Anoplophora glabripennis]|uniref:uncharacterized protein LOC108904820 n=1 Tax=Anoplophora glabripennis TaxID=217634 RepID=UPI0008743877|nr:uncharacterized protein LOC108904820 [Anoplophora glabripennis]